MRRHPALRLLSSEHHTGLVVARRARQAALEGGHSQYAAWDEVRERFRAELEGHFQREERGLLPMMRDLVAQDRVENLMPFADMLAAHIRFEEQTLFDTAQRLLGPTMLQALEDIAAEEPQAACKSAQSDG